MPFLTDAELLANLADLLRDDPAELSASWSSVISAANAQAQADITAALGAMGYSPAQVQIWDRLRVYNRSIGLWYALTDGSILIDFDPDKIDRLDRRKELSRKSDPPFQYTSGGVVYPPAAALTGDPVGGQAVASGRITAADSRISMDTNF